MSGPVSHIPKSIQERADQALNDRSGWDAFAKALMPALSADPFRPADNVLVEIARFSRTPEGSAVIAWLHGISDQAPYPDVTVQGFEHAALAAAKHQGRASVGQVLRKAIAEGTAILEARIATQNQGA